jgi:CHAT domain-containing protein
VFENGLLTAGDIRHLDTAPGLVVANACLSARTSSAASQEPRIARWDREAGLLPSLADEFFKLGVRNYVGASWEVDDLGAIEFAESFYGDGAAGVLAGESIGTALLKTRRLLWGRRGRHGKLWAAYQHYGDPSAALRRPATSTSGRPSQRRTGGARKK